MRTAGATVADDLLESDARYFELGAEVIEVPAARIALLAGSRALPAGCVVQRLQRALIETDPGRWIAQIEQRVGELGAAAVRIYEQGEARVASALVAHGYQVATEVGFFLPARHEAENASGFTLVPAEGARDWETRVRMFASNPKGPDGHIVDPAAYVGMERRRCATKAMEPFLIWVEGEAVGAVCALQVGGLLRMKNLYVAAHAQRRGAARAAVVLLAQLAACRGLAGVGLFAHRGSAGERIYRELGMVEVTRQQECLKWR